MEILEACPLELKLIIISKLPPSLLRDLKLGSKYAETLFKYRYHEGYANIKDITKINRECDFHDYTEEGPYLWNILLKDWLILELHPLGSKKIDELGFLISEIHYISLSYMAMLTLYTSDQKTYRKLRDFSQIPLGFYVLCESISVVASSKEYSDLILAFPVAMMHVRLRDAVYEIPDQAYVNIRSFFEEVMLEDTPSKVSYKYTLYKKLYDYAYFDMIKSVESRKMIILKTK